MRYIYITTNNVNGKRYLGQRKTPKDKTHENDTHLGSGSIAIAAHDYGFELTACELDVDYYNKAIERIKNHTNQTKLF